VIRVPSFENVKPARGTIKLKTSKFPAAIFHPVSSESLILNVQNTTQRSDECISRANGTSILSKSLRSKSSKSSKTNLSPDKIAENYWSATLPRSFIPTNSSSAGKSPTGKSPTGRSSLAGSSTANQISGSSPTAGRLSNQTTLQTRSSARISLNSPTRGSCLSSSPKSAEGKQPTLKHRRSTVTRPKAPVLLTQLRAERHKLPEEDQGSKKFKMTRHSLDQLQTHDSGLDQVSRNSTTDRDSKPSPTATQPAIELQYFPRTSNADLFGTPLPSPIQSEGSSSTFVTASEDIEQPKTESGIRETECVFERCESCIGHDPWRRSDGPAPFVDSQFGHRGRLSNGIPSTHMSTDSDSVQLSDQSPTNSSSNESGEELRSKSISNHSIPPIQHLTLKSLSCRALPHIQDVERRPNTAVASPSNVII
jgi:hypothetical protein